MIEFIEVMFRALTGLKLTFPTIIALSLFFALGYYFASITKRMNPLKAVLVLVLGYILSTVLSGLLGVFTLAVVLGFLSNQGLFLARAILWVESTAEFFFVLKHRATFEDIRQEEQHSQEQAKPQQSRGQQQKQNTHHRGAKQQNQSQGQQSRSSGNAGAWKPQKGNKADIAKALKILEMPEGEEFTAKDVKKAYRKLAMKLHPDMSTGSHNAFVLLGVAKDFLLAD